MITRLVSMSLAMAFSGWAKFTAEGIRARDTGRRAAHHMRNRHLAAAFGTWVAQFKEANSETRNAMVVEVAVLEELVTEYDQQKVLWAQKVQSLSDEQYQIKQAMQQQTQVMQEQAESESASLRAELAEARQAVSLCEGLMAQLMDSNERLRREKESLIQQRSFGSDGSDGEDLGGAVLGNTMAARACDLMMAAT